VLGALIGPLFGILIAGYYVIGKQRVHVDDMFTMAPTGRYWYTRGYNRNAVATVVGAGLISVAAAVLPKPLAALGLLDVTWIASYSWFIGCGVGFAMFVWLERRNPQIPVLDGSEAHVSDGTQDTPAVVSHHAEPTGS